MLQLNGEKMSKSLGNFLTVREALQQAPGEAIRLMLIRAHYRSTLEFSESGLLDAKKEMDRFYRAVAAHPGVVAAEDLPDDVLRPLCDDLNTPLAIAGLHVLADAAIAGDAKAAAGLLAAGQILGLLNVAPVEWFRGDADSDGIEALIEERRVARAARNFGRADEIRKMLEGQGILLEDNAAGTTWRKL
jgi:cysteinyl-tRNA synthetase